MSTVKLQIPDEPLTSLETEAEAFGREVLLLAAVKLFELSRLSSSRAAQLAGLSRVEFLAVLPRYQVSPYAGLTQEELQQDAVNA
jgi:predicted HTH domain antitoxin